MFRLFLFSALLTLSIAPQGAFAQRLCGSGILHNQLRRDNPALLRKMTEQHQQLAASAMSNSALINAKTTAQSAIPVVFHFLVTQAEYNQLGRDTGIKRRVYSQIASLNRDFNGANTDKSKIPTAFSSLYANIGIQFAYAKATSVNTIAPGIEVKILTNPNSYDINTSYAEAKVASTGLPAWDVTKYLNIWVANITYGITGSVILGVTVPPSLINDSVGTHRFASGELGIVLNIGTVGVRDFEDQYFIDYIDKGRTLTHEAGHFFELWHIWGDDDGLCPDNGGYDDDINDTPPQANATYCSDGNCPQYPKHDACTSTGSGIMFMNFMDYVDDAAMFMFTKEQATFMKSQILPGGKLYSLTQNPGLSSLSVNGLTSAPAREWNVSPNPSSGKFSLGLDQATGFEGADVLNMVGQEIMHMAPMAGTTSYEFNLSNVPPGIYFVQCHFAEGTLTKKIILQQ